MKPFKITFSVGGIYEDTNGNDEFIYKYKSPNCNVSFRQLPVYVIKPKDLDLMFAYIQNYFYNLQNTFNVSKEKLIWITSICCVVSRVRKIGYTKREWMSSRIINSKFIICDIADDYLCFDRLLSVI